MKKFLAIAALSLITLASPALAQQVLNNPTITGHQNTGPRPNGGAPPVLSTCGTSPSIVGNDISGRFVNGSGATTCTLTFNVAYTAAPSCTVTAEVATQPTYTVAAAAITFATTIASTAYHYRCSGNPN